MKISKILLLPAAVLLLASCGGHTHTFAEEWSHDDESHWHAATCEHKEETKDKGPHVDNDNNGKCDICDFQYHTPISYEVTSDEWVAAFGLSKPYYIADNYKMSASMTAQGRTENSELIVDGMKLKSVDHEGSKEYVSYNEISGNTKYEYEYNDETKKWEKMVVSKTIADEFAKILEAYGMNYSAFTYDNASKSYKCASIKSRGQTFTNLIIKFEDKKVKDASLNGVEDGVPLTIGFAFIYGNQSVTLPTVDPEPHVHEYNVVKSDDTNHWYECACGEKDELSVRAHYDTNFDNQCDVCGKFVPAAMECDFVLGFNGGMLAEIFYKEDNIYGCRMQFDGGDMFSVYNIRAQMYTKLALQLSEDTDTQESGVTVVDDVVTIPTTATYAITVATNLEGPSLLKVVKGESPVPQKIAKLMGINEDWETGIQMEPLYDGSQEFKIDISAAAGDKVKVKFGDDWINTYKRNGNRSALAEEVAFIDDMQNIEFRFAGSFTIYFNSEVEAGDQFGVFVYREEVYCPYIGVADYAPGSIHQEVPFAFNKVDLGNNFIEFKLINCPATNGMSYTLKNGGNPVPFTLQTDAGEGANFTKDGSTITYNGSALALDFYIKEDLTLHNLTVYVEVRV